MDNLKIWNSIKQPPSNVLKEIKFGYLKGKSDINPQWRLMAMTQVFGVVGHGWTYRIAKMWSETALDSSVMAFVEVAVKTKMDGEWGEEFSGIGGSMIVDKNKNGLQANDEGYKKATTDALGVAFKAVGVAADIYLGNFDGSKYLYEIDQAFKEPPKPMSVANLEVLDAKLKALPKATRDAVRKKYPNFANEPDARFEQIDNGLQSMIDAMVEAKAKAELEQAAVETEVETA